MSCIWTPSLRVSARGFQRCAVSISDVETWLALAPIARSVRRVVSVAAGAPRADMSSFGLDRAADSPPSLRLRIGWWQRVSCALVVWWRASWLDRELAAGTSPRASAVLGLRAQRITRSRSRRRVADGLARAARDAQSATPGFSAAVRPHCGEVVAARIVLSQLERRLRDPEPISARGVALLRTLLSDGTSPLYRPDERDALGSWLRAAAAALEPEREGGRWPAEREAQWGL